MDRPARCRGAFDAAGGRGTFACAQVAVLGLTAIIALGAQRPGDPPSSEGQ